MRIIDVHSHLGDILNYEGGNLIYKKGIRKKKVFDPLAIAEDGLMRTYGLGPLLALLFGQSSIKAEQARNYAATLENMIISMKESNVSNMVVMPITPYVTFEDLLTASNFEPRIWPFTSIDFSIPDYEDKLIRDVENGAFGLKLHPIIQKVCISDERTQSALQKFAETGRPVLTHAGVHSYYSSNEKCRNKPEFGKIDKIIPVIKNFPNINFIVGHAGLLEIDKVIKKLKNCRNVWVDTSFQSPENIMRLVKAFGENKVMYASDWPYGRQLPARKSVEAACGRDDKLMKRIFYDNASELIGIFKYY